MIKQITFIVFIFLTNLSCSQKQDSTINSKKNNNDLKLIVLNNQLEYGRPSYDNPYQYTSQDLNAILPELKKILKFNEFQTLKDEDFYKKIELIFNRKIDRKSKYLYINFLDKCNVVPKFYPNDLVDYFGFFIIRKDNFITENFAIPQIIDYQYQFKEVAENEISLNENYKNEKGDDIRKNLWKDDPSLTDERNKNILVLEARNKYLFNDDKKQLKFLLENDSYFMERLVTNFGFIEDQELLKWVINTFDFKINNFEKMGQLLWSKKCNNDFVIHLNVLAIFNQIVTPDNKIIIDSLNKYISYLFENDSKIISLTMPQKSKLIAYLVYFVEQYRYKKEFNDDSKAVAKLLEFDVKKVYLNEIKKNNYYNLSRFKEWLSVYQKKYN